MYITPRNAAAAIGISESQFSSLRTVLRPEIPTAKLPAKKGRPTVLLSAAELVNWLAQIWPGGLSEEARRDIVARAVVL